jgi:type I restriction enzyme M protein
VRFEDFAGCLDWWRDRATSAHSWYVPAAEILADNCNLDRKDPNASQLGEASSPDELIGRIIASEEAITGLLQEIRGLVRDLST